MKKNKLFKIPVYEPFIGLKEKKYVNDCLSTNWISSRGIYIEKFEKKFGEFVKLKYAISCVNGTEIGRAHV